MGSPQAQRRFDARALHAGQALCLLEGLKVRPQVVQSSVDGSGFSGARGIPAECCDTVLVHTPPLRQWVGKDEAAPLGRGAASSWWSRGSLPFPSGPADTSGRSDHSLSDASGRATGEPAVLVSPSCPLVSPSRPSVFADRQLLFCCQAQVAQPRAASRLTGALCNLRD